MALPYCSTTAKSVSPCWPAPHGTVPVGDTMGLFVIGFVAWWAGRRANK